MKLTRLIAAALAVLLCCSIAVAQRPPRPGGQPGGRPGGRQPDRLKEGDDAPNFSLKTLDGKQTVKLSEFRGKKPVAMIFGSYT